MVRPLPRSEAARYPLHAMPTYSRLFALALFVACGGDRRAGAAKRGVPEAAPPSIPSPAVTSEARMKLTSSAFKANQPIPRRYTCQGDDISPPLAWTDVPEGTRSLALVVTDPDAPDPANPQRTWVHWVVYNLPPSTTSLDEGAHDLPAAAVQGTNDWHRTGYGGPCPPIGRHRYFFTLYALDITLPAGGAFTKAELEEAIEGHVLAKAELMGTYQKE